MNTVQRYIYIYTLYPKVLFIKLFSPGILAPDGVDDHDGPDGGNDDKKDPPSGDKGAQAMVEAGLWSGVSSC